MARGLLNRASIARVASGDGMVRGPSMRGGIHPVGLGLAGLLGSGWLAVQSPPVRVADDAAPDRVELIESDPRFRAAHPRRPLRDARDLGIVALGASARARPMDVQRASVSIVREARRNDLDPTLLAAVARVESRFRPRAVSHKGARGVLQLMPETAQELAVRDHALPGFVPQQLRRRHLYDVETNVALGARYLGRLVEKLGSEDAALAAYNKGPRAAKREFGRRDDWHRAKYVRDVRRHHARLVHEPLALN